MLRQPPLENWKTVEVGTERRQLAGGAHQRQVVANGQIVEYRTLLRAIRHAAAAPRRRIELRYRFSVEHDAPAAARAIDLQRLLDHYAQAGVAEPEAWQDRLKGETVFKLATEKKLLAKEGTAAGTAAREERDRLAKLTGGSAPAAAQPAPPQPK